MDWRRWTVKTDKSIFWHRNFAHRGLHVNDDGIPENSIAAFKAAVDAGYGIELDVQLSKDGQVVVFHDDTLNRVCGVDGRVDAYDYGELRQMSLLGTGERIPLFTEVLKILEKGSGPLICELKNGPRNNELCEKTYAILQTYAGDYCIESFNPFIVNWFRKKAPDVFRGQLATAPKNYDGFKNLVRWLLGNVWFSLINKPDFVAYENIQRPPHVLRLRKKGVMLVAWTSRTPDVDQAQNDAVIFEHYQPPLFY